MRPPRLLLLLFTSLALLGQGTPKRTFRQWLGGQEVGGATLETSVEGQTREVRSREWMVLSRLGQEIRQENQQVARKAPDGGLTFTWRLQLSAEPFEGRAEWSPREPGLLTLHPAHGPTVRRDVPATALLWPEDLESKLKEAARLRRPLDATTFSFPTQQWSTLRIEPKGPSPLPGYPEAIRFVGQESDGGATAAVEVWISPEAGELRHTSTLSGLSVLSQRADLPAPGPSMASSEGFFERSLQRLPPHPFQPWMPEWHLRAGAQDPGLPQDEQQTRLGEGRWRLRRAALPSPAEANQPPVKGTPTPEERRHLAPSPLVPFRDPAFDGLLHRLALPAGLSRWELARRVNTFVFEWIAEKDFTVGFASALEVAHTPRGDCTEHGVLAVALLRRLGVPARGVTGWVGLGEVLGLHFWVEVHLLDRWVPIDPTFDQAPASALRIKLGETDLENLGSVGWETAATAFSGVRWTPEKAGPLSLQGDQLSGPGNLRLRLPGGRWQLTEGLLWLLPASGERWRLEAVTRPGEAQLRGASRMAGPRTLRPGWWLAAGRRLYLDLGDGRWLQVSDIPEAAAYSLLDQLMAPTSSS